MERQLTLEQIINAASDGVIATDAGGQVVFINKEAEKTIRADQLRSPAGVDNRLPIQFSSGNSLMSF